MKKEKQSFLLTEGGFKFDALFTILTKEDNCAVIFKLQKILMRLFTSH